MTGKRFTPIESKRNNVNCTPTQNAWAYPKLRTLKRTRGCNQVDSAMLSDVIDHAIQVVFYNKKVETIQRLTQVSFGNSISFSSSLVARSRMQK